MVPGMWRNLTKDYTHVVPHNKPEWLDMMLDRANSMYQRDKNHPAILIWSCGNESFGGKVIFEMSQLYRKMDPTRLVHYEGVNDDRRYNDTSDNGKPDVHRRSTRSGNFSERRRNRTSAVSNAMPWEIPAGAMHKYTDLTDTEPKYQGGFIWDYIDQFYL